MDGIMFLEDYRDVMGFLSPLYKKEKMYLVGGTIRDILLGKKTKDFDIFVVGSGIDIAREFQRINGGRFIPLDEKRDETRVVISGRTFDFNGGTDIKEDLKRRDFTINSMAVLLPCSRIIDPFGGREDLRRGRIRTLSERNMREDALRILRAFRFKSLYGFCIERKTRYMIGKTVPLLKDIARERIKTEFFFTLKGKDSWRSLMQMESIGVISTIIPGFSSLYGIPQNKPYGDLVLHSIDTVRALEEMDLQSLPHSCIFQDYLERNTALLKLSCLLHDIGKPQTFNRVGGRIHFYGHEKKGVEILMGMRLSRKERDIITALIGEHMRPHLLAASGSYTKRAIARLISACGKDTPGLLLLAISDEIASSGHTSKGLKRLIEEVMDLLTKKEEKKERILTGDDLIALGLTPGPLFSKILCMVEEEFILGNISTKEEAISYVKKMSKPQRSQSAPR